MCGTQPNDKPPALAHRSVQESSSRSTHRDSTTTGNIELIASIQRCRTTATDSFRGQSPLKPRFNSHSQSLGPTVDLRTDTEFEKLTQSRRPDCPVKPRFKTGHLLVQLRFNSPVQTHSSEKPRCKCPRPRRNPSKLGPVGAGTALYQNPGNPRNLGPYRAAPRVSRGTGVRGGRAGHPLSIDGLLILTPHFCDRGVLEQYFQSFDVFEAFLRCYGLQPKRNTATHLMQYMF